MSSDSAYPQPAAPALRVVARRPAIEDPDAAEACEESRQVTTSGVVYGSSPGPA